MNSKPNEHSEVSESTEECDEMVEVLINLIENLKFILYFDTDDDIHPMGMECSLSQASSSQASSSQASSSIIHGQDGKGKTDKDMEIQTWSPSKDSELYPIATCLIQPISAEKELGSDSSLENDSAKCLTPSSPISEDSCTKNGN